MRVFITGASGHIASAVIPELLNNGHQVVGLARSDASAEAIAGIGAEVRRGELDDLDGLRQAASEADGVIHLAFKHESMRTGDFMGAIESDMAATQALGEALVGTEKPFVTTGGTLMLAMAGITGRPGTEDDQSEGGPRVDAANYTLGLAQRGVRSSVIRLAPMVHSDLDHHGFTHALIGFARETAPPLMSATVRTVGRRPTPTTSASCTASRSRRRPPDRPCTAWATWASRES